MEIHLLGQQTNPAVTLSQGALVVINPMTVMTHGTHGDTNAQMQDNKAQTNRPTTQCTNHADAENVS